MENPDLLKERYNKLAKKHNLPSWSQIDKDFELLYFNPVIEVKYPIAFVARRVGDKLNKILENLHSIINPPQHNLIFMKNHAYLTDDDKKESAKLLTIIMRCFSGYGLTIDISEKNQIACLKAYLNTYKKVKSSYDKLNNRVESGWKKEKF